MYGVNSFARKVAQAIGGGFGGFLLTYVGYKSSTTGGAIQSAHTVNALYSAATLIPVVCAALAVLILLFIYPLTGKLVEQNGQILAQRHAQNAAEEANN